MKLLSIPNFNLDALCALNPQRYPFLLQSVEPNQNNRYSILFAHPQQQIVLDNLDDFDFLQTLEDNISKPIKPIDLPFCGGWFVYLSYELIGQIEPILKADMHQSDLHIAIATQIPSAVIVDHLRNQTYLLDEADDTFRIEQILADIDKLRVSEQGHDEAMDGILTPADEAKFIQNVQKIHDYIKAGDVFQVNLSRQWQYQLKWDVEAVAIYRALKKTNPAPFSALAQFEDFSIISSSPERLFSVIGDSIQTRPIAGTYPRGQGEEDTSLKQQLLNHPKERSEHIMLLDLERNDLGRVCQYGSVRVDEMMGLETYPFVHHIVSNIQGKLKQNMTIKHLIKALFPGGTISGCPKIRCMQIISELEKIPRQVYTGSLGYISNDGKMDFNILIRTISKQDKMLTFNAGAGIVFDSIAERELAETKHKASGILRIFS